MCKGRAFYILGRRIEVDLATATLIGGSAVILGALVEGLPALVDRVSHYVTDGGGDSAYFSAAGRDVAADIERLLLQELETRSSATVELV